MNTRGTRPALWSALGLLTGAAAASLWWAPPGRSELWVVWPVIVGACLAACCCAVVARRGVPATAPLLAVSPAALLAYERLRRERVAAVQRGARENGMRYDSSYSDLGVRDAEIAAHAAFRRTLYDHDVVPEAEAAVHALGGP